jgi:hypothetical protein
VLLEVRGGEAHQWRRRRRALTPMEESRVWLLLAVTCGEVIDLNLTNLGIYR